ncbi:MAG TPA: aldose 1-epimerase family protein [Candidatus Ruania gallistercoris]|uniref:Aldose 1-epimerase family protein n=1 Tax=Candidatus Ruania gallistercoris TaxID=2838746 RepID=A0A9D2J4Y4_9MICO|nr:aldose 1-epimerase family protein [Candidatus Ruania gallistercoris]
MTESALPGAGERTLARGDQKAIIVETGAGVRNYTVEGVHVLAGYRPERVCPSARGQWLVPWPNRIRDGKYSVDGEEHVLPIQDPEPDSAIHGLARWVPFQVLDQDASRVELGAVLPARPGYPWPLEMRVTWELSVDGLSSRLTVRNLASEPVPFGAGAHPYLSAGGSLRELINAGDVTIPGATRLTGENAFLTERKAVDAEDDFRTARRIGNHRLGLYTDLERDSDGRARVVFDREDGWQVSVWQDESWPFVLLYTADQVSDSEGRRTSVAVEPMTCAVDAFNSGDGLITLQPGEEFTGRWGISVRQQG